MNPRDKVVIDDLTNTGRLIEDRLERTSGEQAYGYVLMTFPSGRDGKIGFATNGDRKQVADMLRRQANAIDPPNRLRRNGRRLDG